MIEQICMVNKNFILALDYFRLKSYIRNINNKKERIQHMTDFSKYKNITVDNETYATVTKLQTKMTPDVKLSRSQVIKTLVREKARKLNGKLKD
jgi:hypothetical protein